ncbi:MAG: hypothetical protein ABIO48_08055 [Pedococcus sp.]
MDTTRDRSGLTRRLAQTLAAALVAGLGAAWLGAPPAQAAPASFEAEDVAVVLSGGANRSDCDSCSGHKKVGGISETTALTLGGVIAPSKGTYTVTVHYLSGDDSRALRVRANDGAAVVTRVASSGGWGVVGTTAVSLALEQGENTVVLNAPGGSWGPDVDRLTIEGVTAKNYRLVDPLAADPVPVDPTRPGTGRMVRMRGGDVTIDYSLAGGTADVRWAGGGRASLTGAYSGVRLGSEFVTTKQYDGACRTAGTVVTCAAPGRPTLRQTFAFEGPSGFTVRLDVTGVGGEAVRTSMMVPLMTDRTGSVSLGVNGENRMNLVPFDNDAWVRYETPAISTVTPAQRSFEVTTFFDDKSRRGLVVGSLDRGTWKSGIVAKGNASGGLDRLQAAAGLTDWSYDYGDGLNRLQFNRESKAHGTVSGRTVSSPRIYVGLFNDWRVGMETFGRQANTSAKSRTWDKGTPFGFNSWGGLGARGGELPVMDATSKFMAEELPGFANRSSGVGAYVGIDSYWDKMLRPQWSFEDPDTSWAELEKYVAAVKARGQEPALYFQPFANFWADGLDSPIGGTALCKGCPNQTFRQMALKANGIPISMDGAWALDPTNPGVQNRARMALTKFRELGVKYVKLDFLTHGYVESDGWYDPRIQTGQQAFAQGMEKVIGYLGNDMFVDLAISPLFASSYAHARRISCDVHGALNNWHPTDPNRYQKSTEYLLNSLSYGWWLDEVYAYNDGDHIQFGNYEYDGNANAYLLSDPYPSVWPEGQNRARVTSAVITGVYLVSEDFTSTGNATIKERARALLQNPAVNRLAEGGRSFAPVEAGPDRFTAADTFVLTDGDTTYVAAFNYANQPRKLSAELARLGLGQGAHDVTELWTGAKSKAVNRLEAVIPAEDARIFAVVKR